VGGNDYYQRRRQPRQAKKFNDISKDAQNNYKIASDSEDEIDMIANEEIKEHDSKEAPFRQPVHQTKTTLQLLNLKSESSPQADHVVTELHTLRPDRSLEENYNNLLHFEKTHEVK